MIKLRKKETLILEETDGTSFEMIVCHKPEEIPEFGGEVPCRKFSKKIFDKIVELDGRKVWVTGVDLTFEAYDHVGDLLITVTEVT